MKQRMCIAIVEGDRISLAIDKKEKGYQEFSRVLGQIEKYGFMSWYGDVDIAGVERNGLVITSDYPKVKHET